jgi:hypothetical protein
LKTNEIVLPIDDDDHNGQFDIALIYKLIDQLNKSEDFDFTVKKYNKTAHFI